MATTTLARKPRLTRARERQLFFRRFLKKGVQVASFVPSSRGIAKACCKGIDPTRPQVILELGAGTGPITAEALKRMHPESRLLALEIDRSFLRILRRTCPRAEIIQGDVRRLPELLEGRGVGHIDIVINGLPTPSLPMEVNRVVLETLERLAPEAVVAQLTVMPLVYLAMYQRVFQAVQFEWVMANIPPAGVYHCRGLRPNWRECVPGKGKPMGVRRARVG